MAWGVPRSAKQARSASKGARKSSPAKRPYTLPSTRVSDASSDPTNRADKVGKKARKASKEQRRKDKAASTYSPSVLGGAGKAVKKATKSAKREGQKTDNERKREDKLLKATARLAKESIEFRVPSSGISRTEFLELRDSLAHKLLKAQQESQRDALRRQEAAEGPSAAELRERASGLKKKGDLRSSLEFTANILDLKDELADLAEASQYGWDGAPKGKAHRLKAQQKIETTNEDNRSEIAALSAKRKAKPNRTPLQDFVRHGARQVKESEDLQRSLNPRRVAKKRARAQQRGLTATAEQLGKMFGGFNAQEAVAQAAGFTGSDIPTTKEILAGTRRAVESSSFAEDALEFLNRPISGVAEGARYLVDALQHDLPEGSTFSGLADAVARGAVENDTLFSDVLEEAGVKNGLAKHGGGFLLDVVLDPLNWVTLGLASVGKVGKIDDVARGVHEVNAGQAGLKAGLTADQADEFGKAVGRNLEIRFGRSKTVRRGGGLRAELLLTGRIGRAASKGAGKLPGAKVGAKVARDVLSRVNPAVRKANLAKHEHDGLEQLQEEGLALTARMEREISEKTTQLPGSRLSEDSRVVGGLARRSGASREADEVRDVVEQGLEVGGEIGRKANIARRVIEDITKWAEDMGVDVKRLVQREADDPEFYAPRLIVRKRSEPVGLGARKSRLKTPSVNAERGYRGYFGEAPQGTYVHNLRTSVRGRAQVLIGAAARLNFRRKAISRFGRRLEDGGAGPGESLYRVDENWGLNPTSAPRPKATPEDGQLPLFAMADPPPPPPKKLGPGSYVVMRDAVVRRMEEIETPMEAVWGPTNLWKKAATIWNPGYFPRNIKDDFFRQTMGDQTYVDLARQLPNTKKVTDRLKERRQARATGEPTPETDVALTLNGEKHHIDDVIDELEQHSNIIASGRSRDLNEGAFGDRASVARVAELAEDVPRIASYLAHRADGMEAVEAARSVEALGGINYSKLSSFEKGKLLRNAVPFYTFRARNIPTQFRGLATRPGKVARLAHAREEGFKSAGMDDEDKDKLSDIQRQALGFPIGGLTDTVPGPDGTTRVVPKLFYPGLSVSDLNVLMPGGGFSPFRGVSQLSLPGGSWVRQALSSANPIGKAIYETASGNSLSYGNDPLISPYSSPYQRSSIPYLAEALGKVGLGGESVNRQTGEVEQGVSKGIANFLRVIPQVGLLERAYEGPEVRGRSFFDKASGPLTGVTVGQFDEARNELSALFSLRERLVETQKRIDDVPANKKARKRVQAQIDNIDYQTRDLSQLLMEVPYGQKRPLDEKTKDMSLGDKLVYEAKKEAKEIAEEDPDDMIRKILTANRRLVKETTR